ncbi:MAG: MFS transporter [Planctomycetaceae bacterium]|nr:MFS transporter [Planctomycetaceae bacterium]
MNTAVSRTSFSTVSFLVCLTASIGFAFDTYELLMLPLILRPAIQELVGANPGSPEYLLWVGRLFYVPAFTGGLCGLWGGWLTDRFGRRRVLTGSILIYAVAAFVSGYATSIEMLLICRCFVFIGVCVEFVAAVAWLAELFDDPHQRERVIGYTQAFASIGGLLVAFVNHELARWGEGGHLPAIYVPEFLQNVLGNLQDPQAVWRYTLMSGLFPALPLILVRPFLPESPKWKQLADAGTLKRPSIRELFTPALRRTTIVSTLLVGCSYGLAFGGLQQLTQIIPGIEEIQSESANMSPGQRKPFEQKATATYVKYQEVGGLAGRFLLAILAVRFLSRRKLLGVFLGSSLVVLPWLFLAMANGTNIEWLNIGGVRVSLLTIAVFLGGLVVIGQFSFWGNYLPTAFPLHLRGTGESMAANIGGRMIGTSFAWVTATLAAQPWIPGEPGPAKIARVCAGVCTILLLVGCALTSLLPETTENQINEP